MDARPANRHDIVLVVEDEPFTRWMAADVLSSAGFVVLEARSAGEALPILEAHDDVRVVFTDVEMPGPIDGLELAQGHALLITDVSDEHRNLTDAAALVFLCTPRWDHSDRGTCGKRVIRFSP